MHGTTSTKYYNKSLSIKSIIDIIITLTHSLTHSNQSTYVFVPS